MGTLLLLGAALALALLGKDEKEEGSASDKLPGDGRLYEKRTNEYTGQEYAVVTDDGENAVSMGLAQMIVVGQEAAPDGSPAVMFNLVHQDMGAEGPNAYQYLMSMIGGFPDRKLWVEVINYSAAIVSEGKVVTYGAPMVLFAEGSEGGYLG